MTTQRSMTLLEAAEWFRYSPLRPITSLDPNLVVGCPLCGNRADVAVLIVHTRDCPYAAAVRAIEQARGQQS